MTQPPEPPSQPPEPPSQPPQPEPREPEPPSPREPEPPSPPQPDDSTAEPTTLLPPAWQPPAPDWQQQAPPGYEQQPQAYGQPQGYQPGTAAAYGTAPYDAQAKSKIAAGLLGIFLGGFGVHRFYLGYTRIGVIQIIVTILTCGIGSLWGFVEGILYLVGANGYTTDADGRPLKE